MTDVKQMARDEYLERCKQCAREYLDEGDVEGAITSMGSDLRKHPEFTGIVDKLLPLAMLYMINHDLEGARRWIEGFR